MASLLATVTNVGASREAQKLETGKSFRITHFEIGSEGHDPGDPLVALVPDPGTTETAGRVFGPEPIDDLGYLSATCPYWTCIVESGEANGALFSSISLIATIVYNGTDPVDEVGRTFVYAVANFPRTPKTIFDVFTYDTGLQL